MRILRISEIAREIGWSERWLRDAEAKGRIPRARRDLNGWRVYTKEDISRIEEILYPGRD